MSGHDEGLDGVAEPGSGAKHMENSPGQEGGAHGQTELGALRAFVEAGLHNVEARLDQQANTLAQVLVCCWTPCCQAMLQEARASRGQASCLVTRLRSPRVGEGATPQKWPPTHVWGSGSTRHPESTGLPRDNGLG